MDRRHGGEGQCLDGRAKTLPVADVLQSRRLGFESGELSNVRASDEARGFPRANHQAAQSARGERLQVTIKLDQHIVRERIGRATGLVESQPGDLVAIGFQTPGRRAARAGGVVHGLNSRALELTWKSHTSGRWSEKRTAGIRNEPISMPALTRMKSSSMRGRREGKECSPSALALRS